MPKFSKVALPIAFLWSHAAWAVDSGVAATPDTPPPPAAAPAEAAPVEAAPAEAAPAVAADPAPVAAPVAEPAPPPDAVPAPVPTTSEETAAPEADAPKKPSSAGPFARGRIHVGGSVGFATTSGVTNRSWFILGLSGGVFLLDGLEVHADSTAWFGDPFAVTLTPGVRYVFHMVPVVKPYVGTFYRHYFLGDGRSDSDSLGARLGVNLMIGKSSYVAAGAIYEHFLDSDLFSNPDQLYPEVLIGFAF